MQIDVTQQGAWTVFTLDGKIDNAGSEELKAALFPKLEGGAVALDFSRVQYVTSSGFRVLIQALKEQRAKGGRLLLGGMTEPVRGFFEMAGLGTVFKIVHNIGEAVQTAP